MTRRGAATALTVLNWLPLEPERDGIARLWATHPPLKRRLEQLQQLERDASLRRDAAEHAR